MTDLLCPIDGVQTRDANALFCRMCGETLCHYCPHCRAIIPTRTFGARPVRRCPDCAAILWQCRSCGSLALPGHPCENPGCAHGSTLPNEDIASQLSGGSGRTGTYRVEAARDDANPFLSHAPRYLRLAIPGEIRGVAAGTGQFWLFCAGPSRLVSLILPDDYPAVPPVPQSIPMPALPAPGAPDPIGCFADRLYLLSAAGAILYTPAAPYQTIPGHFVAQCLHEKGWLLVEETTGGAVIHRLNRDGTPLPVPAGRPAAVPFPERRRDIAWCLPVADADAAYLTDDDGQAWRFPWDGSAPSRLGTPLGVKTTLLLEAGQLYVLPIGNGSVPGLCLDLAAHRNLPLAAVARRPLAAAIGETAHERQLWLGAQQAERLVCLDRLSPAQTPRPIPGASGTPNQICTVRGPGGTAVVLATVIGPGGPAVAGWQCAPPHYRIAGFDAVLAGGSDVAYRLAVCPPWLSVWSPSPEAGDFVLYYLS